MLWQYLELKLAWPLHLASMSELAIFRQFLIAISKRNEHITMAPLPPQTSLVNSTKESVYRHSLESGELQ